MLETNDYRRFCAGDATTVLFYFLANDPTSGPATEPRYYYEVKNARGKAAETAPAMLLMQRTAMQTRQSRAA
jgi:hypothetical protein